MPTILNSAIAGVPLPYVRGFVQVKETWDSPWIYAHRLRPLRCTLAAAPEVPSADLAWIFGEIKDHDQSAFALRSPVQLQNWYARILLQAEGSGPQPIWTGVIAEQTNLSPSPLPEGQQMFRAFGLAHLLDNYTLRWSRAAERDGFVDLDWVPTFNQRHRRGKWLLGNRSDNTSIEGVYGFGADGSVWTNKDIVESLLAWLSWDFGIPVTLSGQTEILASIEEVHSLEGLSLWDALNRLIDRRRGVGFHLEVDDAGVRVECWSVSDTPVTVGERTLPANPRQVYFGLPTSFPFAHFVGPIAVRNSAVVQVNKIIAQSERVKVTATWAHDDDTLEIGWTTALENLYEDGAGSMTDYLANDRARTIDRFDGVFTRFRVPTNWAGKVKNGENKGETDIRLWANQNGFVQKPDADGPGPFWRFGKRFLRELPFEVGKRYDTSGITVENVPDSEPEFRSFFVWYHDTKDGVVHSKTDKFYFVDQMYHANPLFAAISVRTLDKDLGFQLGVTPRHYFAKGEFDGTGRPTGHLPELYYSLLGCTGTIEMDVRAKIELERRGGGPETGSTHVITVEGAEYWYVAPGTIVDIDKDGKPVRIYETRTYVRQDREKLEAAAAQAAAWFGPRRQPIVLPIKRLMLGVPLGTILTGISSTYATEPVRTPVTAVRLDFQSGETEIETGYTALDFG